MYAFVGLLFKILMNKYDVSSSENIYYSSIIVFGLCIVGLKKNKAEILNIPEGTHGYLLCRVITGVLSDWLTFLAF